MLLPRALFLCCSGPCVLDTLARFPRFFNKSLFCCGVIFWYRSLFWHVRPPLPPPPPAPHGKICSTQEQLFISGGGVLPHLVKEITSDGIWCAGSLQTAFDLLGELCKGNRQVSRRTCFYRATFFFYTVSFLLLFFRFFLILSCLVLYLRGTRSHGRGFGRERALLPPSGYGFPRKGGGVSLCGETIHKSMLCPRSPSRS